mmetsp:Transcript_28006/g.65388  ORF Transcript_28006/g.65388 Transcript_28006/m.65388 type:complete len:263 (+) Transcript_28006:2448-3236(+)
MGVAAAVLPPFVGKFEDDAPDANPSWVDRAGLHYLLRQLEGCLCLGLLVNLRGLSVVCIGTILTKEDGSARKCCPLIKQVSKAQATILVDPPDVNVRQCAERVPVGNLSVDSGNGVCGVVLFNDLHRSFHPGQRVWKGQSNVQSVVVPLVANDPHQNGGVILDSVHALYNSVHRSLSPHVDGVEHVNASFPEDIQHISIRDRVVGAYCVDAGLRHQPAVRLHKASEIKVLGVNPSLGYRVPAHSLQVQRVTVDDELTPHNLD